MEISFGKRIRSAQGFTLIELLVVIAIIAILAAILFPVFARVREKARQTSCLSNQKQLGLAFTQYNQDYDEHYPPSVTERYSPQANYAAPGTGGAACGTPNYVANAQLAATYSIRGILNPYVKSVGIWHDPSQATAWAWDGPASYTTTEDATADNLAAKGAWFLTDYGFNFDEGVWADQGSGLNGYGIAIANGPTQGAAGTCVPHSVDFVGAGALKGVGFNGTTSTAQLTSPSTFILGADTKRSLTSVSRGSLTPQPALTSLGKRVDFAQGAITLDASQAALDLRHSDGANFIYADGHAKWRRPETTWKSATNNEWLRVQP